MNNLFSHAPQPAEASPAQAEQEVTSRAIYLVSSMPLDELWTAFTEYSHLWWPAELKRDLESYIEFGEEYLLEEEENGTQHLLGQIAHFVQADVIALRPEEAEFKDSFRTGLSFVFEEGEGEDPENTVEISSGLVLPRDLGDSELGVVEEDIESARLILGGFARFIRADLHEQPVS